MQGQNMIARTGGHSGDGLAEILELGPHILKNSNSSLVSDSQSLTSWALTKGEGWGSSWDIWWHPAGQRGSFWTGCQRLALVNSRESAVRGPWADLGRSD